jgi:hypothetical protein
MSVFSHSDSPDIDSVGAGAPNFTRNACTAASALTLGGFGVAAVALTATIAPAQTLAVCGIGGALAYTGQRQAQGKSLIPAFGAKSEPVTVTPVTETV